MFSFRIDTPDGRPQLVNSPKPTPTPGEVLIEVATCGLNFADLLMVKGTYQNTPQYPFALGMEIAGRVVAVGADVTGFKVGSRVAAFVGSGGLAEYVTAPAEICCDIPDAMDDVTAAGFQIAYGTSHLALSRRARLMAGETLVVLGAAGGVGLTAVEIGHAMGAKVVAVARGAEKQEIARSRGAHHTLDAEGDLRAPLLDLGGADVVYDPIGGTLGEIALRCMKPEGRYLAIGFASGDVPQVKANHLLVKNHDVIGVNWGGYLTFNPDALTSSIAELFAWHAEGRIHPHISAVLPLKRAAEGLAMLRDRTATGKVVIAVRQSEQSP